MLLWWNKAYFKPISLRQGISQFVTLMDTFLLRSFSLDSSNIRMNESFLLAYDTVTEETMNYTKV
jgi:hypothetical protein